ncbi:mediator complex, subunit Med4 [Rhodotorula toruloides]|uniref:Mediator of RNA polymerase II transcription subunit 4 n=1 Tax=Rhodotorula toruloides TaxID=5286 RepID=A0A511KJ31_RHOTO|nr:mediator complex, subunit Med4 [Rhodotorula toruloides]
MAVTAASSASPLSSADIAQIPSPSLPIGPQISHLLSEFANLSIQLFMIFSTTSPSASAGSSASTAKIYESLGVVDEKLARLLVMYSEHQRRQQRVEALVSTLRTLDSTWHESASTLHSCVSTLDPIVASGDLDRRAISTAQSSSLTPSSLLSYARLLAPFTSAPPSSLFPPELKLKGVGATDPTGRSLPMGAIPPFPTEAAMRRGRLQFGREGLMQGLGATEEVGVRPDSKAAPAEPTIPRADAAVRLEQEAKAHRVAGTGGAGAGQPHPGSGDGMDVEEFEFDLDLNPDL